MTAFFDAASALLTTPSLLIPLQHWGKPPQKEKEDGVLKIWPFSNRSSSFDAALALMTVSFGAASVLTVSFDTASVLMTISIDTASALMTISFDVLSALMTASFDTVWWSPH